MGHCEYTYRPEEARTRELWLSRRGQNSLGVVVGLRRGLGLMKDINIKQCNLIGQDLWDQSLEILGQSDERHSTRICSVSHVQMQHDQQASSSLRCPCSAEVPNATNIESANPVTCQTLLPVSYFTRCHSVSFTSDMANVNGFHLRLDFLNLVFASTR